MPIPSPFAFFLGGSDLEMVEIARLIRDHAPDAPLFDAGLAWGAKASDYADAIAAAAASGRRPVLVELAVDMPLPNGALVVDHHGDAAGAEQPTSLHRIFALLNLPAAAWTRRMELVAANDRGHIRALRAAGATEAEIAAIRRDDRAAQGVTAEMEAAGERAVAALETVLDGRARLARLPHAACAVVTDRLDPDDPRPLIVLSPAEVNAYGPGAVIAALDRSFPGGWRGGALPAYGFWGHTAPLPDEAALLHAVAEGLEAE